MQKIKISIECTESLQRYSIEQEIEGRGYFRQLKQSLLDAVELHELRLANLSKDEELQKADCSEEKL